MRTHEVLRVDLKLRPKPAADVGRDHMDAVLLQSERVGDIAANVERRLRGNPDRQPAIRFRDGGIPGVILVAALGGVAWLIQRLEERLLGHAFIDDLVIGILLGMFLRVIWTPGERWSPGIGFSAKQVLELAVLLLGASVSFPLILKAGPALPAGIAIAAMAALGLGVDPRALRQVGRSVVLSVLLSLAILTLLSLGLIALFVKA